MMERRKVDILCIRPGRREAKKGALEADTSCFTMIEGSMCQCVVEVKRGS